LPKAKPTHSLSLKQTSAEKPANAVQAPIKSGAAPKMAGKAIEASKVCKELPVKVA